MPHESSEFPSPKNPTVRRSRDHVLLSEFRLPFRPRCPNPHLHRALLIHSLSLSLSLSLQLVTRHAPRIVRRHSGHHTVRRSRDLFLRVLRLPFRHVLPQSTLAQSVVIGIITWRLDRCVYGALLLPSSLGDRIVVCTALQR